MRNFYLPIEANFVNKFMHLIEIRFSRRRRRRLARVVSSSGDTRFKLA